jgi:hypothetical protein
LEVPTIEHQDVVEALATKRTEWRGVGHST